MELPGIGHLPQVEAFDRYIMCEQLEMKTNVACAMVMSTFALRWGRLR